MYFVILFNCNLRFIKNRFGEISIYNYNCCCYHCSGEVWHCIKSIETSHEKTIRSIKWSPCDNLIASCGFDGRISVWKDGEECATVLEGHGSEVKSIDWSPDGLYLASCCRDKTVWIWESRWRIDFIKILSNSLFVIGQVLEWTVQWHH